MGKHEREEIEKAEKIIVKILNNQYLDKSDTQNHWYYHALEISKEIKKDFPNVKKAIHLGNRYDNTGDILLLNFDNSKYFIELKMSDTKFGVGTKANISQDALTENNLFIGKVKSWSEFRNENQHDKWVNNYLNTFHKYPNYINELSNTTKIKEEKARYLRKLKTEGNLLAKNILNKIHELDKQEKIKYLRYLSTQQQNEEMVKRFFILIILGVHKKNELKSLIENENFFYEIQNFYIYYANRDKNNIIVRLENTGERIKKIINKFSKFKIIFPQNKTHCKLVGIRDNNYIPLLQIVLHWKNIAQGIKTPCLNIFDLTHSII